MSNLAYHVGHYKQTQVGGIGGHNWQHRTDYATHSNPDIVPERSSDNMLLQIPDSGSLYVAAKQRIATAVKGRVTSASNWITETITYPPEDIYADGAQLRRYFGDVLEWHRQTFGADNVLAAVVHMDETTPHMHLDMTPITADGRLSSKAIFTRSALSQQHTQLSSYLASRGWDIQRGEVAPPDKPRQRARTVRQYKQDADRFRDELDADVRRHQEVLASTAQCTADAVRQTGIAQQAAREAAQEAQDAEIKAQEAQSRLNDIRTNLEAVASPEAIQRLQAGKTIGGNIKLTPEQFETLKLAAEATALAKQTRDEAIDARQRVLQSLRDTQDNLKSANKKLQEKSCENDRLQTKVTYLTNQVNRLMACVVERARAIWRQAVKPIRDVGYKAVWTVAQAVPVWKWEQNRDMVRWCTGVQPEINRLASAVGGKDVLLSRVLDAEEYSEAEIKAAISDAYPKPEIEDDYELEY